MEQIQFLIDRFLSQKESPAIAFDGRVMTYGELADSTTTQLTWLIEKEIAPGTPVVLHGDYSPLSVAMLLALIERQCILIPLTTATFETVADSLPDVAPRYLIDVTGDSAKLIACERHDLPSIYTTVTERKAPGLVLFTSGSSGKPKAVVHDFSKLLGKFHVRRPAMITLNFLLFDHWGGLNTLLHCLSNLCLIVLPERRTPEHVCDLISRYRIELLPTTPSFLNVLLVSKVYVNFDLSSLRLVTYGAEPMPEMTLRNLTKAFPAVELRQTYGMIELGVLRAKSRSSDSLWVKLGGEGYKLRVVDGILQIQADAAMIGYVNAESPFTDDGYLITGDLVETDGEWIRILGRHSDIINVGGQKVYPAEVESVLMESPAVADAVVYGESNPLVGKVVCADIVLHDSHNEGEARRAIKRFCAERLQSYMVPAKIKFVQEIEQSHRLKRVRARA